MATPSGTKTVRVSAETHEKLMTLADRIGGTADDAIAHLLGESTVRVPVSAIQRQRWSQAAATAGVGLSEFVRMRVEGAIMYGGDPSGLQLIYEHVLGLTRAAGVRPIPVNVRPRLTPEPSPTVDRPSTDRPPHVDEEST